MASACLGKAAYQRVGTSIQKDHARVQTQLLQLFQLLWQLWQSLGAAHVHGDGYFFIAVVELELHKGQHQLRWKVVHTVKTSVFQRVQRNGLARP